MQHFVCFLSLFFFLSFLCMGGRVYIYVGERIKRERWIDQSNTACLVSDTAGPLYQFYGVFVAFLSSFLDFLTLQKGVSKLSTSAIDRARRALSGAIITRVGASHLANRHRKYSNRILRYPTLNNSDIIRQHRSVSPNYPAIMCHPLMLGHLGHFPTSSDAWMTRRKTIFVSLLCLLYAAIKKSAQTDV